MALSKFLVLVNQTKDVFNDGFYISSDKHKAVLTTKPTTIFNYTKCCCMMYHHFNIFSNEFICLGKMTRYTASVISDISSNTNIIIQNVLIIDDTSFVIKYKDKVKGLDIFKKVVYNINDKREIDYKMFNI